VLNPTFTATTTGFTVRFGLDSTRLPTGYDSYDLTITFDPTKYKLLNTSYDFVGDLKSINDSALASGRLVISAVSSSQKISGTTALGTLNFQTLVSGPLVLGVSRLNVNGFSYVTDSSPLTLNSTSGTSGGGQTDTTPPLLSSSDPAANATVTPSKELLTLTFNEAIVLGTGTIQLKTAAGSVVESFDVASSSRVVRSGSTVTIDPVNNFIGGTSYILSIPAGAFKDAASNSYAGTNLAFATSASTTDITAPTLALATPSTGATGVSTSAKIVLKFSEAVKLGSGQIRLLGAGGALIQAFDSSGVGVAIAGDTITLSPTAELAKASTYTLQIPSGAIADIAGNAFAGISSYQFTTASLAAGELTITVDRTTVNEGNTISFSLASTSTAGSVLNYTLSGVAASDLDGTALSGTLTLNSSRTAKLSIKLKADNLTEGTETLVLNIGGVTSSVTINDTSVASITPQNLTGSVGPEVFLMTTGVDSVDGGSGIDTAFVNDDSSEYEFTRQGNKVFMAQKSSQNIDTLVDVERVEFVDLSVALDTDGGPGQAYRIYKAAFNREPDKAGIGYWISKLDNEMDMIELAQRFVDSAEFQTVYGTKPSNAEFVAKLYQNVLGRSPDATGYTWWVNKMNTDSSKSFAKVLADFSEGTENTTALAGQLDDGVEFLPWLG
jgi:methionine-rich copper-binding protein CopC